MMNDTLVVCQWNMRGLEDPNRVRQLKTWLKRSKNEKSILCLQETKIDADRLRFQLKIVNLEATQVLDVVGGKVGATTMIPKSYQVLATRKKGDGTFAWAKVMTVKGELNIGSIYTPNERRARINPWKWMGANLNAD